MESQGDSYEAIFLRCRSPGARPEFSGPASTSFHSRFLSQHPQHPQHIMQEVEELELPPVSAGKLAVALAISLVDRAYCLGAITDDRRQTLLQKLRIVQADLDRVVGRLIEGSVPFYPVLLRNASIDIWRFRISVEAIEDAIDEINYRRLEEEVGNPISMFVKRKIINKVPSGHMKLLKDSLLSLGCCNIPLDGICNTPSFAYERYGYPSWLATAEGVSGREQNIDDLIQWLTKDDAAEGNPLSVCTLLGGSGVGKTTVANMVLQDPRVLTDFDFNVWVQYVSNREAMMKVILEKISGKPHPYSDMNVLEILLVALLEDKKFLLILDHVSNYPGNSLVNFLAPLKVCREGSKILLMTQYPSVVDRVDNVMGAAAHVIHLEKQLPSQADSESYPEITKPNVPFLSPNNHRYPIWISKGGIFGRDREREQIVQWLTMDTDEENPFSVYALVGMAGIGKTTLASIVCHDPRVQPKFKAVVWVPVSIGFDTEAMARCVLEKITGRPSAYSSVTLLLNSLTETLRYRKVLLILDDIWEDRNVEKWETFVSPLRVCKKGSKILLTTRMQSVVDMAAVAVGSQVKYMRIDELHENDNLMLFKSRLPSQLHSKGYDNLLLIGEQIAKKIGGLPLVTSLVASWLGRHMDAHNWNMVLQKGLQHLEESHIVLSSLRLSYDCLSTELQTCFRYCSLFPKEYKFKKMELAKMWSRSGLVPFNTLKLENIGSQKRKYVDLSSAEDIGEEYFDVLTTKSFFCRMLETKTSDGNQQEYYVLHGLLHDLAQHVSKGECARVDSSDLHSIKSTTRHLSIGPCCNLKAIFQRLVDRYLLSTGDFTNLRTLIIQIEFGLDQETELVLMELLKKSRNLRLLYLGVPSLLCALDSVPNLIHLRYLFLFSCDEYHLQKFFKLYHLQLFRLEYLTTKAVNCINIHSLRCLHSLHVPDNMSSMIHDIGRLTLLQELHGFEVVKHDGRRLNALGNLRSLCQLSLRGLQNVLNFKEAADIKLKEKNHLKLLSLSWNKHLEPVDQDGKILNNLEPNKEIQLLQIHGYNGVKLPVWIENPSLTHLVSLELDYCMKWKSLPSLKELSSLKHLKLENLFQLEYIGTVLEQRFEIDETENAWLPPLLSTLTVQWCPNLKELPYIPCSLELLIIKHVHLAVLPGILQRYTGGEENSQLGFLHIESCAQLTSLSTGLLEQQKQLRSLHTLVLRHCERLHHLPTRGFTKLHHLTSLEVVACPILKDVKTEDRLLPLSLRNLDVNPCGDINVSFLMALQDLTSLKRLTLFNCSNVEELPSAEVFETLKSINDVSVAICKNLISLGGLGAVASLRILLIQCCDKLTSSYSTQDICTFKLQNLRIDRQALLLVEPLRSLRHTRGLHISDDSTMVSLPGEWLLQNRESLHSIEIEAAESLRVLPSEIEKLELLESLHIERAPLLQSLPQLPASLRKLKIWGCDPGFLKCYEKDVGLDWGKIAHIASVDIQAYSEDMSYCDDQNQDLVTSTGNPYRQYIVID